MKKHFIKMTILFISFCFISGVKALNADDYNYATELAKFPTSYQNKIKELHNIYPNAIFVADYPDNIGSKYKCSSTTYNTTLSWDTMVNLEYNDTFRSIKGRSLIQGADGYKATESWAYNYYTNKFTGFSGGSWFAANKQTIKYYLNSLNFINEKNIFMFESLNYNSSYHNKDGVEKILAGTFMADTVCPGSTKKYSEVILEAALKYDISPYFLASRLKQEQGTSKGAMVSGTYPGYEGYYNYFNIKANGTTTADVIKAGLEYAKSQGWNSEYKSIINGAYFVDKEYVEDGQNTLYLQKWDATGTCWANHQYMQNIIAPYSESLSTYNSYKQNTNYKNLKYLFFITVWEQQSSTTSLPNSGNPNNYLKAITVEGATLGEESNYKNGDESYSINVSTSRTSVNIGYTKVASTSSVSGAGTINLTGTSQVIPIKVTAQNGAVKTYKVTVTRDPNTSLAISEIIGNSGYKTDGTYLSGINVGTSTTTLINKIKLISPSSNVSITKNSNNKTNYLATGDKVTIKTTSETKTYTVLIYGDVNGDGYIKATDYVKVKNHIMGTGKLSGAYKLAADVNRDGNVKATDYVKIKNHIMGSSKISQ